ncbi:NAD-dependent epimerase/dehydratase family protein [Candidatus Marinimicrobia bacterium]|nr:NAD-dependent epimerase/dehydratase family protein [Candidatus Neomarinimicrobiota bacterium]
MRNKILVTGSAGFIGFHLCKSLLKDGFEILGIDNVNNYYDSNLKHDRLALLNQHQNFTFEKIDISDRELLTKVFTKFRPQKVVNFAAQAGVRHSIENPYVYMDTNLVGFLNIIELCRHNNVEGLIYASSSSVYGGNEKIPFSVDDRVDNPISIYAASKRANELIANSYSHLYGLHTTGLRFFTVYGPWGRPDMAMHIFAKNILNHDPIQVFNNGDMKRDFTYIDDIVSGTKSAIDKNFLCKVFNLGNNKSEKLMDVIGLIEKKIGIDAQIEFLPMQLGDVKESFADIAESSKSLGYFPTTDVDVGISKFIDWFEEYYD